MTILRKKNSDEKKKTISSSIARVAGAVRIANVAVSEAVAIRNEAIDEVEAMRTKSNDKTSNLAIKKMETETIKELTNNNR